MVQDINNDDISAKEIVSASEILIDRLTHSDGWDRGAIIALQIHVERNSIPKAKAELKFIKDLIDNHNANNPHDLIEIKALLNEPAPYIGEDIKTTMLDFANLYNFSEMKSLLKAYGASETKLTSYCPGFWNKVNDAVKTVSEVTGLSTKP